MLLDSKRVYNLWYSLGFKEKVIVGGEVAGIGHERAPGGPVIYFFPDVGFMCVSLCDNSGSCTLMIYILFCMYIIIQ